MIQGKTNNVSRPVMKGWIRHLFVFLLGAIGLSRSEHSNHTQVLRGCGLSQVPKWTLEVVCFQRKSSSHCNPTQLQDALCKFEQTRSCGQVSFACWDADERNHQLLADGYKDTLLGTITCVLYGWIWICKHIHGGSQRCSSFSCSEAWCKECKR